MFVKTTQLIYTVNELIGIYIAVAEIEASNIFSSCKDCHKANMVTVYFNSFYYLLKIFLKLLNINFLNLFIKNFFAVYMDSGR